jgi:hypothetical protein
MNDYKIDFLKLVKDKTTFLYEDNDNDKENKPSEELEKKIAESVANDFELWNKIDETINYWYQNKEFLEVK